MANIEPGSFTIKPLSLMEHAATASLFAGLMFILFAFSTLA